MPDRTASNALVTGSNRGLGLEWCRQLAGRVDQLFATCRTPDSAPELTALAEESSNTVDVFGLDLTDPGAIRRAADRVRQESGHLDLLINNAGVSGGGSSDRFGTVAAETMMQTFRVNTVGPHLMTQAFADVLRNGTESNPAKVVNVTSELGSITNAGKGGWHSYKASKAALNMCTRLQAAALESDGIVAVALHPGWVRTDMGGSNARLSTEESVEGMIDVVSALTLADAGRYFTYDGDELPW